MAITLTPVPGVTLEEMQAHLDKARKVGMRRPVLPTDGPTAQWVVPAGAHAVICPTCDAAVNLNEWWSHGCKAVPLAGAARLTSKARLSKLEGRAWLKRELRKRPITLRAWTGDVPTACNHCGGAIHKGFADAPLSNGRTWGILCGMCWTFTVAPKLGQYYEKRHGNWVRTESRP
jgi:hypothetical protein